ncbi:MAG: hypothetical protein M1823_004549 [Watsoniomyces obsoletus]|nr:MAG: hypothetical protein M1823_004549 [Watsoniomyces obsoletus]
MILRAATALGLWAALAVSTLLRDQDQRPEEFQAGPQTVLEAGVEKPPSGLALQRRATSDNVNVNRRPKLRSGVPDAIPKNVINNAAYKAGKSMAQCAQASKKPTKKRILTKAQGDIEMARFRFECREKLYPEYVTWRRIKGKPIPKSRVKEGDESTWEGPCETHAWKQYNTLPAPAPAELEYHHAYNPRPDLEGQPRPSRLRPVTPPVPPPILRPRPQQPQDGGTEGISSNDSPTDDGGNENQDPGGNPNFPPNMGVRRNKWDEGIGKGGFNEYPYGRDHDGGIEGWDFPMSIVKDVIPGLNNGGGKKIVEDMKSAAQNLPSQGMNFVKNLPNAGMAWAANLPKGKMQVPKPVLPIRALR